MFLFVESYQRLEQLLLKFGFLFSIDARLEHALHDAPPLLPRNDVTGRAEAAASGAEHNSCRVHHQAAIGMGIFVNVLSTPDGFPHRRP